MGRQPHMTRVVLKVLQGRSAYEPLERRPNEDEIAKETRANAAETIETGSYVPGLEGYIQQYDHKGYPENLASRLLSRQSRRAQNDVLATVGVCVVDERANLCAVPPKQHTRNNQSIEKSRIRLIRRENEIGMSIAAADLGLFCLSSIFLLGLRHRMQTFRFYTGVPFVEVLKIEWKRFGFWQFFFAGAPASFLFIVLDMFQAYVVNSTYNKFTHYVLQRVKSDKRREHIKWAMGFGDQLLRAASFVILAPLEIFATLQRLDLVPSWPLFPDPITLIPFTQGSPIQAHSTIQISGLDHCTHLLTSLALSPLALWWILFYIKTQVDQKLYSYMRIGLPKPDWPDIHSWKGAREDELDSDTIPGLGLTRDLSDFGCYRPTTLYDEVKTDIVGLLMSFREVLGRWRINKPNEEKIKEQATDESEEIASIRPTFIPTTDTPRVSADFPTIDIQPAENSATDISPTEVRITDAPVADSRISVASITSVPSDALDQGLSSGRDAPPRDRTPPLPDSLDPIANIPFNYPPQNQDWDPNDNPTSHPASQNNNLSIPPQSSAPQENDNPNLQIHPTTTETNTTAPIEDGHISPSIPITGDDMPPTASGYLNNRTGSIPLPPPSHHVTALTAHFADAMGCHLSTHLADIIFFPLEALFVRSVALGFLASSAAAHSPVAAALRKQVLPPGTWLGMGFRGGARTMADYAGKMALCASLDVGVGYAVWQIGAGVAWWVGRRWFRWGSL